MVVSNHQVDAAVVVVLAAEAVVEAVVEIVAEDVVVPEVA